MQENTEDSAPNPGMCPLLDLPCPQGQDSALQCRLRVESGFDPVASFADYYVLECAREQAARARERTIKYL